MEKKKTAKATPDSEGTMFLAPILFVLSCFMICFRLLGRSRVYLSWEKKLGPHFRINMGIWMVDFERKWTGK